MKVSVVIAVYNRARYIGECVESILAQDFQDFEIVVADDHSDDGTIEILRQMAVKDKRIRIIANQRHRFIETLNMAMDEAQGEYIARIDSDDVMISERLDRQVAILDQDPTLTVCTSWYKVLGTQPIPVENRSGMIVRPFSHLLMGNFLTNPTSMIRRSFLIQHQLRYHEDYIFSEDYKLWSEIARLGGGFYIIPERLTYYRFHDEQLSVKHCDVQTESAFKVRNDILNEMVYNMNIEDSRVEKLFSLLASYNEEEVLSADTIFLICYELMENKYKKAHYLGIDA